MHAVMYMHLYLLLAVVYKQRQSTEKPHIIFYVAQGCKLNFLNNNFQIFFFTLYIILLYQLYNNYSMATFHVLNGILCRNITTFSTVYIVYIIIL